MQDDGTARSAEPAEEDFPPPGGAAGKARGGRGRALAALGVFGELLITLGLVLGLFVAYSLWWTNVQADRSAAAASDRLRSSWAAGPTPGPGGSGAAPGPGGAAAVPPPAIGDDVGFLHVPAMGRDYQVLIRMGTSTAVLDEGVAGVYEQPYRAAMPWDRTGNFALAAHRDGHGARFHDLDAVHRGDAIVVETKDEWYVYKVDNTLPETSKYDTGIVAPVPASSGYTAPGRYITLTTCTPVYTSRYRMAVWGSLVRVDAMDARRTPPPELRHS
ncbi:class E sortase [Kitasatospora aureofaciens]|uniref:Class E sortase n=1 Tax=Kitasatospora aureofaciens TaxID=1894 RepID=A0A1E7NB24_KITAU|nr:class E sortase [Kitasatospora aureofaciens]QEV00634.1 class E sortase [Streptomyces viridifaciens]ARF79437.1 class E sortase [Kitasatospora aureofaciens]OEV37887.1 class E sortase [Kitasatospora aureofaciens]UKZ06908.1 class E sortase [Streptomyces viridifaciens]GGU66267.1 class E sortase [Kitasatospora aureofaciens]